MRGRKIDSEFFEYFINYCIKNNKVTNEEILQEAQNQLNNIDEKIKEVEKLKPQRSKLLDVISSLQKEEESNKISQSKLLKFYNLNNKIAKSICDKFEKTNCSIKDIFIFNNEEECLTIKQLIKYKIIYKVGDCFIKGSLFEEYYSWVKNG